MNDRKTLSVSIDWKSMFYACMDVYCACGEHFHVDVHDNMQRSPEHLRCPHCQRVYRLSATTPMTREDLDFRTPIPEPHTFVQWKGTELHGTAHCDCGSDIKVHRDFAYVVECLGCNSQFNVNPHVRLTELSADEVTALPEGSIVTEELDGDEGIVHNLSNIGKGGTDISAALANLFANPPARGPEKHVIIVTDGPPPGGFLDEEMLLKLLHTAFPSNHDEHICAHECGHAEPLVRQARLGVLALPDLHVPDEESRRRFLEMLDSIKK